MALLDANVLFPFSLRDCLLWAAWSGLYQPRWSAAILDEVRRNLLAQRRLTREQAARLLAQMQRAFPEALVIGYEARVDTMTTHPGDRHVAAAAVHASADVIVTQNLRHFPNAALRPYALRASDAETFLLNLVAADPMGVDAALVQMAASRSRPLRAVEDILLELASTVPRFVTAVHAWRNAAPKPGEASSEVLD